MKLLAIQLGLWILFIFATAHVGVFMVPFGSLAGIAIVVLSPNASVVVKIFLLLAGLGCLSVFAYGIHTRETRKGILLNVAGLYLWCLAGYVALSFQY